MFSERSDGTHASGASSDSAFDGLELPAPPALAELLQHIDDWTYEEEIGAQLEYFKAALALAEGPQAEYLVYKTFAEAAERVDWGCVVTAQELLLDKLESMVRGAGAAASLPAGTPAYLSLLETMVLIDDSPSDLHERYQKRLAAYSESRPFELLRDAIAGILTRYDEA